MFITTDSNLLTIKSRFTRKSGYVDIESSSKINHKKAIQMLNSFTPQGASPKVSLRIGSWNEQLGLGYYFMEDDANARISTIFINNLSDLNQSLNIPMSEDAIEKIAYGDYQYVLNNETILPYNLIKNLGFEQTSMIIYSLLTGDNIIIIHSDHKIRVGFIKSLLGLIPTAFFKYNRITTGCSELDGNENIIGVERLPRKYRSHKKLYMALDTIFVDLKDQKIMGEGIKSNLFTNEVSQLYQENPIKCRQKLIHYFESITKPKFDNHELFGLNTEKLTMKIREKLGLETVKRDNWLMSF